MDEYFWETLYLFKQLYDHGCEKKLLQDYQNTVIDGDYVYELSCEAMGSIFADTRNYYNEELEIDTWVFMDPLFQDFYTLCEDYERQRGIPKEMNAFRERIFSEIHSALSLFSYSYRYEVDTDTKRRLGCRLVLLLDVEFCVHYEVPGGLLEIRDALKLAIEELKQEMAMGAPAKVIPLPNRKERRLAA